jgi:hypothetical protein
MITLNMTLLPGGSGIGRSSVLTGSIWTTDDLKHHAYSIQEGDGEDVKIHTGMIPKERSGHRNPFHLLLGIASDILDKRQPKSVDS